MPIFKISWLETAQDEEGEIDTILKEFLPYI